MNVQTTVKTDKAELQRLSIIMNHLEPGGSLNGFEGTDAPTIIVGNKLAAGLGVTRGMVISIVSPNGAATPFGYSPRRKPFMIGGVFGVGMAEYDSTLVYMPLEQAQVLFSRGEGVDEVRDLAQGEAEAAAEGRVGRAHRVADEV